MHVLWSCCSYCSHSDVWHYGSHNNAGWLQLIGSIGFIGGAKQTFAFISQECLWQYWYSSWLKIQAFWWSLLAFTFQSEKIVFLALFVNINWGFSNKTWHFLRKLVKMCLWFLNEAIPVVLFIYCSLCPFIIYSLQQVCD